MLKNKPLPIKGTLMISIKLSKNETRNKIICNGRMKTFIIVTNQCLEF